MNLKNLVKSSALKMATAAALAAATVFAGTAALATDSILSGGSGSALWTETITVQENGAQVTYDVYYADGVEIQRVPHSTANQQAAHAAAPASYSDAQIGAKTKSADFSYKYVIECTATAYDPSPEENGGWGGMSATGVPLQPGVIAVDPKVIPLGSRVYIESLDGSWTYGYALAADTGGAIKGNRVDLLFLTKSECYEFGRRKCRVYVL